MATLAQIKGSEVKLRESLTRNMPKEFRADVQYAYKFVKARRRLAERRLGIRKIIVS